MSDQSNDHTSDPCPIHGDEPCPPPMFVLGGGGGLFAAILAEQARMVAAYRDRLGPERFLIIEKNERIPRAIRHVANLIVSIDSEGGDVLVEKSKIPGLLPGPLVRAETANDLMDALEHAWGLIANAQNCLGDLQNRGLFGLSINQLADLDRPDATDNQSSPAAWAAGARRFREAYHALLDNHLATRPEYISARVETEEVLSDPEAMEAIYEAEAEQIPNTLASYGATTAPSPDRDLAIGQRVWSAAGKGMWATIAGYPPSTEHYVVDWAGDENGDYAGLGLCPEHCLHTEDCIAAINEMGDSTTWGELEHGHPNSIVDGPFGQGWSMLSGDEVAKRMEMGLPVEVLYRGEWRSAYDLSDFAVGGLIVAARVPEPVQQTYRSTKVTSPGIVMGETVAFVDEQRLIIKRRKTVERSPDKGDRITLYFESETGDRLQADYDPVQLIEVDPTTLI